MGPQPSAARTPLPRLRAALHRSRLWRATAALAALVLLVVIGAAAQGSVTVVARAGPAAPGWVRPCLRRPARPDRRRLAFCARVSGIVLASTRGPSPGESHVAMLADFHLVIVRLPDGARTPGLGAHVRATGPLLRARDGQREVQAFAWGRG